jgi:uncharacterized protein with WD repeat
MTEFNKFRFNLSAIRCNRRPLIVFTFILMHNSSVMWPFFQPRYDDDTFTAVRNASLQIDAAQPSCELGAAIAWLALERLSNLLPVPKTFDLRLITTYGCQIK